MADTTTALGLTKVEVGASEDTWGAKINTNMDTLDALITAKQATITGAASSVVTSNLSANTVPVISAGGKFTNSTTTTTELGYLNSVTSDIQTQIDSKQDIITGIDDVGAYAMLSVKSGARGSARAPGTTLVGSSLEYANSSGTSYATSPTGTWTLMGRIPANVDDANNVSLWLKTA